MFVCFWVFCLLVLFCFYSSIEQTMIEGHCALDTGSIKVKKKKRKEEKRKPHLCPWETCVLVMEEKEDRNKVKKYTLSCDR